MRRNNGIASILAPLFLTMFATMAVAYPAATDFNVRTSKNNYRIINTYVEYATNE